LTVQEIGFEVNPPAAGTAEQVTPFAGELACAAFAARPVSGSANVRTRALRLNQHDKSFASVINVLLPLHRSSGPA
jgi:hypothetical protein